MRSFKQKTTAETRRSRRRQQSAAGSTNSDSQDDSHYSYPRPPTTNASFPLPPSQDKPWGFVPLQNLDVPTCKNLTVLWTRPPGGLATNPPTLMELRITSGTVSSYYSDGSSTDHMLARGIRVAEGRYTWQVDLQPDTYSLVADPDPLGNQWPSFQSQPFQVVVGEDTSCLDSTLNPPIAFSSSPSPSTSSLYDGLEAPSSISSSDNLSGGAVVASTSPTTISSSDGLSGGVIAACTIAAALAVFSVIGIYILLMRRSKRRRAAGTKLPDPDTDQRRPNKAPREGGSSCKSPAETGHSARKHEFARDIKPRPSPPAVPIGYRLSTAKQFFPFASDSASTGEARKSSADLTTSEHSSGSHRSARQSSLPKLLIPVRRDPSGKDDILPPLPESTLSGTPLGTSEAPRRSLHGPSNSTNSTGSGLQPVRRPPLAALAHNPCVSSTKDLPLKPPRAASPTTPETVEGDSDTNTNTLSRSATNTTMSSYLIPSMFRRSLPQPPVAYSAAKPESVFGLYTGNAKEGFDGRSVKSRPSSYFYPAGTSSGYSSPLPPSAWSKSDSSSSTPVPTPTAASMRQPSLRSVKGVSGKYPSRLRVPSFGPVEFKVDQNTFKFQLPANIPPPPPLPPMPSQIASTIPPTPSVATHVDSNPPNIG